MKLNVLNMSGKSAGTIEVSDAISEQNTKKLSSIK